MDGNAKEYPNVVSVVNLKGGVGKTTLCVNLSYGLTYFLNKKVLLIDLDPQANATQYLLSQRTYKQLYLSEYQRKLTVLEVFDEFNIADRQEQRPYLSEPGRFLQRVFKAKGGYLDLLASKLDLSLQAFEVSQLPKYDQIRWFIESVSSEYDLVLIDCPPTISKMLISAIESSQFLLIPVKPDFLSTIGLPLLHRVITRTYPQYVKRAEWLGEIRPLGLIFTMVDKRLTMTRDSISDVNKEARRIRYPVFDNLISNSTKFTWSSKLTLPIFRTQPKSRYALEIFNIVNEFDKRLERLI